MQQPAVEQPQHREQVIGRFNAGRSASASRRGGSTRIVPTWRVVAPRFAPLQFAASVCQSTDDYGLAFDVLVVQPYPGEEWLLSTAKVGRDA